MINIQQDNTVPDGEIYKFYDDVFQMINVHTPLIRYYCSIDHFIEEGLKGRLSNGQKFYANEDTIRNALSHLFKVQNDARATTKD